MDRDRVRLVRGRVRPPALGGRRRAADVLRRLGPGRCTTILITLAGFVAIYTTLLVIEIKLMLKAIRKGPDDLPALLQPTPRHRRAPRRPGGRRSTLIPAGELRWTSLHWTTPRCA